MSDMEALKRDVEELWKDFKSVETEMIQKRTAWSEAFTRLNALKREQEIEEIVQKRVKEQKP